MCDVSYCLTPSTTSMDWINSMVVEILASFHVNNAGDVGDA